MNRKMFALLLILPVAVFATEKIVHAGNEKDGGNKEKRRSEVSQPGTPETQPATSGTDIAAGGTETVGTTPDPNAPEVNANSTEAPLSEMPQAEAAAAENNDCPKPIQAQSKSRKAFNAAAIAEVRAMMDSLMNGDSNYYEENHVYFHPDEVGASLHAWLKKAVYAPLREVNPVDITERSFSRCPSGYHLVLVGNEEGVPTSEGWMVADRGCADTPIARFRYDYKARTVEALAGTTLGYIPIDQFLQLAKAAQG